jgi:hypothetical protein
MADMRESSKRPNNDCTVDSAGEMKYHLSKSKFEYNGTYRIEGKSSTVIR